MRRNDGDTRTRLMDAAEELAQTRGYNGFSFRELSLRVGIRAPSIFHHFATKAELGRALMARYRERFAAALAEIAGSRAGPKGKITRFVELFQRTLARGGRLCLCGMLAAEYATLPAVLRRDVRRFFEESEAWLAMVIDEGRRAGVFSKRGTTRDIARTLFAALEGAMIAARTFGDDRRLASSGEWLVEGLVGRGRARGRATAGAS